MTIVGRWSEKPTDAEVVEQREDSTEEAPADLSRSALPMTSRFLFVNVAGKRATQLRRGAQPQVEDVDGRSTAERLAMEEVRRGLIPYDLVE